MTLFLPVFTTSQLTRAGHSILSFLPHSGDVCSLLEFLVSFNPRLILLSSSLLRLAAACYPPPAPLHNPSLTYLNLSDQKAGYFTAQTATTLGQRPITSTSVDTFWRGRVLFSILSKAISVRLPSLSNSIQELQHTRPISPNRP